MTRDQKQTNPISRRRILYGAGSMGAVGLLAGCSGDGGDAGTTTGPGDTEAGDGDDTGAGDGGEEETTSKDTTSEPEDLGRIIIGQSKAPLDFDPMVINDIPSIQVMRRMFSPLYTFGEGFNAVPHIASDQPEVSREGERYVVPLSSEPRFHNGDPVTAEDVKYSFKTPVRLENANAPQVDMIDTITIVDDQTVQFDLKFPYGAFDTALVWEIVPRSVREEDPEKFNHEQPIGSGPFKFTNWMQGEYVEIERWDDYWDEPKARVETARFRPIEEPTTRVTTLQNQEVDLAKDIPPKLWTTVENMDHVDIQSKLGVNYYYIGFNCKEGPTANPKVREALDYAVDLETAVQNYVAPVGERMYSPVPRTLAEEWNFPIDEWKEIPKDRDLDRAGQLLEEAGVNKDYEFTIIVPPDDKRESIGVTMGNAIREAGFSATTQRLDWGAYIDKYTTGDPDDYNVFVLGSGGGPDPDDILYYLFTHEMFGVANGSFYYDETMNDALMEARRTPDFEKRRELYITAITRILENRAHLPVYGLRETWAVGNVVQNYTVHPYGQWNPRLAAPYGSVMVDK